MRHTNKEKLVKGLRILVIAMLFTLLGPGLIYEAFKNQGHPYWIPVLIIGLAAFIAAIYFGFKGIGQVVGAVFGDK